VLRQSPHSGQIFFTAHERPRPYDTHLFAVDICGGRCVRLTQLCGQHLIGLSPNCTYYSDCHGSLDRDLTTDLHKIDGAYVQSFHTSSAANMSDVPDVKEIVVRSADGRTELWGALVIPPALARDSDRFPIVDFIYNGPYVTWSPSTIYESKNGKPWRVPKAASDC
jgi:dipeptidyl-peptidase-4